MDKDRRAESHGQSSWLDMQQFIGDLLTSGSSSVHPPSVRDLQQQQHHPDGPFHLAWGVAGSGADGLGPLKGPGLAPMTQPRALPQTHDKSGPAALGRQTHSGAADRSGQTRDRRGGGGGADGEHHGCTCPGCPFSSSAPVFETLRPRQPSRSAAPLPVQDPSEPCSSTSSSHPETPRAPGQQTQGKDPHHPHSPGQASGQTSEEGSGSPAHLPQPPHHHHHHLPMLPCLCSLQSCAQLLGQMEGADSSHGRHHFHPCAFAACLPCPAQLSAHGRARAPPQPAFPCYAFAACPHLCQRQQHHHHGEQRAPLGVAAGGAAAGRTASTSLPHPCMHCPASFARPSQLLQHQRSEHANKQGGFICTECGRSFNSHSNLRIHLNVHTGARPYACADCGKSFSQSGALKIHRRTHTGERPYACNYCGRGFPHLAGVRAHQRTHTGEKPYHCNQCGKCFTQSGALKIHVRIHTGERPFVCSLCGKAFSNRSGIRFHYRAVHAVLPEPAGTGLGTPGRPRGATSSSSSSFRSADPPGSGRAPGPGPASADDRKPRAAVRGAAAARPGLPYACEDCGLCFKDAPSRNAHQALTHYSDGGGGGGGGGEGGETPLDAQRHANE